MIYSAPHRYPIAMLCKLRGSRPHAMPCARLMRCDAGSVRGAMRVDAVPPGESGLGSIGFRETCMGACGCTPSDIEMIAGRPVLSASLTAQSMPAGVDDGVNDGVDGAVSASDGASDGGLCGVVTVVCDGVRKVCAR